MPLDTALSGERVAQSEQFWGESQAPNLSDRPTRARTKSAGGGASSGLLRLDVRRTLDGAAQLTAVLWVVLESPRPLPGSIVIIEFAALAWLLWTGGHHLTGQYARHVRPSVILWLRALGATVVASTIAYAAAPLFGLHPSALVMTQAASLVLGVYTVSHVAEARLRTRRAHHVLVVGTGPRAVQMAELLAHAPAHRIIGFVDDARMAPAHVAGVPVLSLDALDEFLMTTPVDEVCIGLPLRSCYVQIERVVRSCERAGIQVRMPADLFDTSLARTTIDASGHIPGVTLRVVTDDWRTVVKRTFDIAGALMGLILGAGIFLVIAFAIRLSSPGPVFFVQERYGYRKRRFRMVKFRTMVLEAEEMQRQLELFNDHAGPIFKMRDDPRITAIGRFLRRTSLDELPQLWNVLWGDMSLVGPRPMTIRDVSRFEEPWLMRRFSVRPGLTGLWQVSGRSHLTFDDWMHLDLRYIDEWSLMMDARILLRTIPAVLKGAGAM